MVTLRAAGPGDLGWIIQRHGELYAAEQGYLRANVRTLNRAIGRLRSGDGMADLTDDEVEALLADARRAT